MLRVLEEESGGESEGKGQGGGERMGEEDLIWDRCYGPCKHT